MNQMKKKIKKEAVVVRMEEMDAETRGPWWVAWEVIRARYGLKVDSKVRPKIESFSKFP